MRRKETNGEEPSIYILQRPRKEGRGDMQGGTLLEKTKG
jgi:hypothetical protein